MPTVSESLTTQFKEKCFVLLIIFSQVLHIYLVLIGFISSVTQSCPTLCNPMDYSMSGFPVRHQLPELAQTYVHWVGDAIQPSHPLAFPSLPAFHLSQHEGLLQWFSSLYQVAQVLELQFQHQSFQWIFISFRMDWFDFLAVQGTLRSLLQHHSSKTSIFQHSYFYIIQLSHAYMTTGKFIALI